MSQSGVGFGVSVKFRSGLRLDDGCSITVYVNSNGLDMVITPIYRKWQNDLSIDFISLSVLHQSQFPLANHLLSSNGAFLQEE